MKAYMRVLGSEDVTLAQCDGTTMPPGVVCVDVPGFGALLVVLDADHPMAGEALLTRGRGHQPAVIPCTRVDGRIEIELLHKADRLCVVVEP